MIDVYLACFCCCDMAGMFDAASMPFAADVVEKRYNIDYSSTHIVIM